MFPFGCHSVENAGVQKEKGETSEMMFTSFFWSRIKYGGTMSVITHKLLFDCSKNASPSERHSERKGWWKPLRLKIHQFRY